MGSFISKPNLEKENYYEIRKNNEEQLRKLKEELNQLKENKELDSIDALILTYEKIFEIDNTNEEDVLNYLLLFLTKLKEGKIDEKYMKDKLDIFNIFISDDNYIKYFQAYERVNSITKINNLIELLKTDLDNDDNFIKRKEFIDKIYDLKEKSNTFYSSNIKFKRSITWKNTELYLFNIYMNFLESLVEKIDFYKNKISNMALESKVFLEKQIEYSNSKDEKVFKELQNLIIYEGEFIKIYIKYFQSFLEKTENNYNMRFPNNINFLNKEEDRIIFEDYIQFLSSYNFNGKETHTIANFWNETFVQITDKNMLELIENVNHKNKSGDSKKDRDKLIFDLKDNKLIIKQNGVMIKIIDDIDNYVFENLLNDLDNNTNLVDFDYYMNKNLKPNYYKTKLFVMKNKNTWKELTINILNSKALKEAQEYLFESAYIDILSDREFLSDVIDNINFFIYKTNFIASSKRYSQKIYEYGLYRKLDDTNLDLSLLIFYAFNNISNIHEIPGHLNVSIQNRFNSNNKSFESPDIQKYNSQLFSSYAKPRGKESGEKIEIILFGRKIDELTTKEALFSLDPLNYIHGLKNFKERFKKCNQYELKDLVHEWTKNTYFKQLGININATSENLNSSFPIEANKNKINENIKFKRELLDHPIEFYYNIKPKKSRK